MTTTQTRGSKPAMTAKRAIALLLAMVLVLCLLPAAALAASGHKLTVKTSAPKTEETTALVEAISKLPGIRIEGLMTIAPYVENAEDNRDYFRKLKHLSVDIEAKNIDNVYMNVLSMGMTGDYCVAVEEGATCVRVGTGIFGERVYH